FRHMDAGATQCARNAATARARPCGGRYPVAHLPPLTHPMSPRLPALAILALALAACSAETAPPAASSGSASASPDAGVVAAQADTAFADLSKRYLDEAMALSPVSATQIGDHRFDHEIDDLSAAGRARADDFNRRMLAELDAIELAALSRENQVDARILRNQLEYALWDAQTMQSWAWDPQIYSGLA